jgi:hypothetical protein
VLEVSKYPGCELPTKIFLALKPRNGHFDYLQEHFASDLLGDFGAYSYEQHLLETDNN